MVANDRKSAREKGLLRKTFGRALVLALATDLVQDVQWHFTVGIRTA